MAKSYTVFIITVLYTNLLVFSPYPELAVRTLYQGADAV